MLRESILPSVVVRLARAADAMHIESLLAAEDLDRSAFALHDFVVAETPHHAFAGCARLKVHEDCVELSSVAVHPDYRGQKVGQAVVSTLLARPCSDDIHLMCEPKEVPFFERFGFVSIKPADIPLSLQPKLCAYELKVGAMVVMRRQNGPVPSSHTPEAN